LLDVYLVDSQHSAVVNIKQQHIYLSIRLSTYLSICGKYFRVFH